VLYLWKPLALVGIFKDGLTLTTKECSSLIHDDGSVQHSFLFLEEHHVRQYQKQYWNNCKVRNNKIIKYSPTVEKALKTVFRVLFERFEGIDIRLRFSGYTVQFRG